MAELDRSLARAWDQVVHSTAAVYKFDRDWKQVNKNAQRISLSFGARSLECASPYSPAPPIPIREVFRFRWTTNF